MTQRMKSAKPAVLVLVPLLAAAGCVDPNSGPEPEGSPSEAGAAADPGGGVADRGDRGGPIGGGTGDVGAVKTEATGNDTVELFTAPSAGEQVGEGGSMALDWTSRLSITFTSAERDGDDVVFAGEATYLHDEGGYLLHGKDFSVLVPDGSNPQDPEDIEEPPEDGATVGYATYTAADAGPLAELTQEEPSAEFSVAIADVPAEQDSERHQDGTTGRYLRYETPQELWGHEVNPPQDYIPGRLCYVEGGGWHDVPLFEYTDVPCG
ncbi:hypothetical protein [Nocardiopsis sp. CNT-189]|uniref:hypothetical protein n=1 Tax=Nocardiopsis oceanisediminis TaxID=2816862 RepID=UPI003B3B39BB